MSQNDKKMIRTFLNDLAIISENKNELYSILIPLLLSKKFFRRGSEIKTFIETVLNLNLRDYVYKSRTILLGKVIKYISNLTIEEAVQINEKISHFLVGIAKESISNISDKDKKSKSQKQTESFFSNWFNYINNSK